MQFHLQRTLPVYRLPPLDFGRWREPVIAQTVANFGARRHSALAVPEGESAIQAALLIPPQLVINYVMMRGMNGTNLGIAIRWNSPPCTRCD
jgi:DNA-binding response OmpR family regulator